MSWIETGKDWLTDLTGLTHDALHIHFGIAIFLVLHLVLRRPLGSWLPAVGVLLFAILGELGDYLRNSEVGRGQKPVESLYDIANTMVWPVLLTLAARWHNRRKQAPEPQGEGDST